MRETIENFLGLRAHERSRICRASRRSRWDRRLVGRAQRVGGDGLRSLDAIHLAAAVALGTDVLITHDDRFAAAARSVGLEVTAPT